MKTVQLTLSGEPVSFGPLLAATLRDHKEAIKAAFASELGRDEEIELTVKLATASARRVDPTMTEERMSTLIDTENASEAFSAAYYNSIPPADPGEKKADSPST